MNIFDEALKSLDEAMEYEQGNSNKGREVVRTLKPIIPLKEYSGEDIKRIREAYNYTQSYSGNIISLTPLHEVAKDECPLLGLTAGSSLTVDKFLAMTREDKILEGLES